MPEPRGVNDALSCDVVRSCMSCVERARAGAGCDWAVDCTVAATARAPDGVVADAGADAVVVAGVGAEAASFFMDGDSGTTTEGVCVCDCGPEPRLAVASVVVGVLVLLSCLTSFCLSLSLSVVSLRACFELSRLGSSGIDNFLMASAKSVSRCEGRAVLNRRAATGTTGGPASTTERERARFRLRQKILRTHEPINHAPF